MGGDLTGVACGVDGGVADAGDLERGTSGCVAGRV